jgi:hypothetical protein
MGLNDDWAFAYTAAELARTGEIRYGGWAPMPLLPQAWPGALVIRLFGFSFTALRLSTVLLGAACGAALYGIGRQSGLGPRFALFASLAIVLSPLFLPLAVSFMTDVPAFLLELICLYSGLRALHSVTPRRCQAWTLFTALAGVLGGMNRQFLWGLALWSVLVIAWRKRAHLGMAAMGMGLGMAIAAACWLNLRWFAGQPYTVGATPFFFNRPPGYLVLLIRRGCDASVYDRYLLPMLPGLLIPLLWHYQQLIRDRIPVVGWVVLVAFGSYAVATTHDYLAAARARLAAATSVHATGVPRRHISAGIEYDGWTQIQEGRYVIIPTFEYRRTPIVRLNACIRWIFGTRRWFLPWSRGTSSSTAGSRACWTRHFRRFALPPGSLPGGARS